MIEPRPGDSNWRRWLAACAALLCVFGGLSYSAALRKSATIDEPIHVTAAFMSLRYGDHRIDPPNPPLWGYWAALPNGRSSLRVDLDSRAWSATLAGFWLSNDWVLPTLYRTRGNDGAAFLNRSRFMMMLVGVACGALVAWWAWKLAGGVAAVTAATLFALDPNLLGHASLVKNDLVIAMLMAAMLPVLWRLGIRATPGRVVLLGLICGAAAASKFSGLSIGLTGVVALAARVALPRAWPVGRWTAASVVSRSAAAAAIVACVVVVGYVTLWASYGFRYSPTPDPSAHLPVRLMAAFATKSEMLRQDPARVPTAQDLAARTPSLITRTVLQIDRRRLLPQPWSVGLLHIHASMQSRPGYLLGEVRTTGWRHYFPLAVTFKEPVATLAAGACAAGLLLTCVRALRRAERLWLAICLVAPVLVFGLPAITGSANVGIRHLFPIYPPVIVPIALAAARAARRWRRPYFGGAALLLAAVLAAETLAAYPHYISFFNVLAGGPRGGLALLGDSNLDWGQDLKLLAEWRREHRDRPLYLHYFGTVPAEYYVDAAPLRLATAADAPLRMPPGPGYAAISATHLQGLYLPPDVRDFYRRLLHARRPAAVLGGSIYIFDLDDPPDSASPPPPRMGPT